MDPYNIDDEYKVCINKILDDLIDKLKKYINKLNTSRKYVVEDTFKYYEYLFYLMYVKKTVNTNFDDNTQGIHDELKKIFLPILKEKGYSETYINEFESSMNKNINKLYDIINRFIPDTSNNN